MAKTSKKELKKQISQKSKTKPQRSNSDSSTSSSSSIENKPKITLISKTKHEPKGSKVEIPKVETKLKKLKASFDSNSSVSSNSTSFIPNIMKPKSKTEMKGNGSSLELEKFQIFDRIVPIMT